MDNVIELRQSTSLVNDFNLLYWCKKQYENYLKRQNDIKRKKLKALLEAAYNFYLDLYLTNTKNNVDICEFLYKNGNTICQYALDNAVYQLQIVIKENRIDECFTALKNSKKTTEDKINGELGKLIHFAKH